MIPPEIEDEIYRMYVSPLPFTFPPPKLSRRRRLWVNFRMRIWAIRLRAGEIVAGQRFDDD